MPAGNMSYRKTARNNKRRYTTRKKPIFKKVNAGALVANTRRKNLVKLIKDININMSERKYRSRTVESGGMFHNLIYQFHGWGETGTILDLMPSVGTTDSNRVGDRIYIEGIMLRATFAVAGDRRNTIINAYWVPHNSDNGDPSSDLFHNVTGSTMVDPVQKKRYPKAYKLGKYQIPPSLQWYLGSSPVVSENTGTITINKFIPINKKVYFNADADNKPTNLHEFGTLCLCPFQNWKTLETDQIITGGDINMTLYFKDL